MRTLRLSAGRDEWIGRGRVLVEDALRVADFGAESNHRLVVVRYVDLGCIDPERHSRHVADRLESSVRELVAHAVRFDAAGAARADAVFFPDAETARAAFLRRILTGPPPTDWFWSLALPATAAQTPTHAVVRAVLLELAEPGPRVLELARITGELLTHRVLDPVLALLEPDDGLRLLTAIGAPTTIGEAGGTMPNPGSRLQPPVGWAGVLARWAREWGARDGRTIWLAASSILLERPGLLDHPLLTSLAVELCDGLPGGHGEPHGSTWSPAAETSGRTRGTSGPVSPVRRPGRTGRSGSRDGTRLNDLSSTPGPHADAERERHAVPQGSPRPRNGEPAGSRVPTQAAVSAPDCGRGERATFPSDPLDVAPAGSVFDGRARPTEFAGFFFLVSVLRHLGIEEALDRSDWLVETELPCRLMREIGRRAGIPQDDPAIAPLGPSLPARVASRPFFVAPKSWWERTRPVRWEQCSGPESLERLADGSGRLTLALWQESWPTTLEWPAPDLVRRTTAAPLEDPLSLVLSTWTAETRLWIRRRLGSGVMRLIRRAGWMALSRTHIDLMFDLADADLSLRRLGLDADPGWTGWLGRVVSYHYVEGGYRGD
ncbi:MAG: hypothetical protein ACJ8DC_17590 [Gemmatimonadales bacterium]